MSEEEKEAVVLHGVDLRDWFAGQALSGMLAGSGPYTRNSGSATKLAANAYLLAGAMLSERKHWQDD